jgi:hypothetical protein
MWVEQPETGSAAKTGAGAVCFFLLLSVVGLIVKIGLGVCLNVVGCQLPCGSQAFTRSEKGLCQQQSAEMSISASFGPQLPRW